jgi:hypothetical protein
MTQARSPETETPRGNKFAFGILKIQYVPKWNILGNPVQLI